jgi:hypothetical protein
MLFGFVSSDVALDWVGRAEAVRDGYLASTCLTTFMLTEAMSCSSTRWHLPQYAWQDVDSCDRSAMEFQGCLLSRHYCH